MTYKLEVVEWVDSAHSAGWHFIDPRDEPKATRILSVGWVVVESETVVRLVPHREIDDDEHEMQVMGDLRIPKTAIISRRVLE